VANWETPFSKGNAGQLDMQGEDEMRDLGSRFRGLFPQLLARPYSPAAYQFISTQACPTQSSKPPWPAAVFPDLGF